jgi:hypothetical protein
VEIITIVLVVTLAGAFGHGLRTVGVFRMLMPLFAFALTVAATYLVLVRPGPPQWYWLFGALFGGIGTGFVGAQLWISWMLEGR